MTQAIELALSNIEENLHLIELFYLLLNLGLTGRSQNSTYTLSELIAITNRFYHIIGQATHLNCKNILIQEKNEEESVCLLTPKTNKRALFGGVLILAIVITGICYLTSYIKLNNLEKSLKTTLTSTNQT